MQDAQIIRSEISLSRNRILTLNICHIMIWKFGERGVVVRERIGVSATDIVERRVQQSFQSLFVDLSGV